MSKYFASELIELNQLFLLWFDKDFDTRRASDNNWSSVLVKRDKYENILTITSINKGYLPSSPIRTGHDRTTVQINVRTLQTDKHTNKHYKLSIGHFDMLIVIKSTRSTI